MVMRIRARATPFGSPELELNIRPGSRAPGPGQLQVLRRPVEALQEKPGAQSSLLVHVSALHSPVRGSQL